MSTQPFVIEQSSAVKQNHQSQQPILEVDNLHVDFNLHTGTVSAVKGVSFNLHKGETLALVGESGSGKSVTSMSILQLLPNLVSHPKGQIRYDGLDLLRAEEKQLCRVRGDRIAMVFQEPMTSLNPLQTIEMQVAEVLIEHKAMTKQQAQPRVLELFELVGIPNPKARLKAYPHELSGGQRQRVMIAMALACEPDILIADEPTTALDVTIQAQIMELLKDLQDRFGMAILFITHDLGVVHHFADRVCVMRYGEIVEQGITTQVFNDPKHPYTRELLDSEPKGKKSAVSPSSPILLEAKDIRVEFPIRTGFFSRITDSVKAVNNISLKLREGQTLGIVGESGSGKSTLGKALLRLISSEGKIQFEDEAIDVKDMLEMRPLRRRMQVVFQDPFGSLSPRMTVAEVIAEGLKVHEPLFNARQRDQAVCQSLEEVDLDPALRNRYPHEFSGGQRQRIAIARAMVLKPKFLLLDEPTSALDRSVQVKVVELLRDLQKKHALTYLFISHDLAVVKALSDEVIVMQNGNVVEQGSAEQIFQNPKEIYTQQLLAAAFDLELVEEQPQLACV
ncbi:ABC transporter ATP-binding protein [Motiliproteus sp. MSK22-1]|uniref:ABC transporter ATP-binding protein n=1 Tax=Motiliproteus sp. MSK22-1 TaxID=1897630 RepID=UPI0009FAE11B|nr:ABC transporter ATP-binding protein [Motiliproteus sp. MSK22-1]